MTSIRRRLLVTTAVVTALAFLVSGALVFVLTEGALRSQFDDALRARAQALAALVEQDQQGIESELAVVDRSGDPTEAHQLWNDEGEVLARSEALHDRDLAVADEISGLSYATGFLPDGRPSRQITLRFVPRYDPEDQPAHPQAAVLVVARTTTEVDGIIQRIARVLAGIGAAGIMVSMGLLVVVIRYALSPAQAVATAIAAIGTEDLDVRLDRGAAPTELEPIVDRLNDLLARLDGAFTRERELTAEVAHELRTPLSGLRATLEVTLSREREAPRYRTALIDCLAICLQAERVVEAMLALARLEADGVTATAAHVELPELVREVLVPFGPRITERQLTLETTLDPSICCDRDKFRVVLQNLIDNAISYTDTAGTVWIAATSSTLRVTNTGCLLTPAEVVHVFERFWRGDRARSDGAHAGLGLALCKKLVQVMGGTIMAEIDDGRFIVTVAFTK